MEVFTPNTGQAKNLLTGEKRAEDVELRYNQNRDKRGRFAPGGSGKSTKMVDKSGKSDIIEVDKEKLSKYIGKPIIEADNQHIREWYYANVTDTPNQIDKSKSFEDQVKQAFNLRNKYKHEARVAMSDEETAKMLEKKRPVPTFDALLNDKTKRKHLTKEEALKEKLATASKTNADVNKDFGL